MLNVRTGKVFIIILTVICSYQSGINIASAETSLQVLIGRLNDFENNRKQNVTNPTTDAQFSASLKTLIELSQRSTSQSYTATEIQKAEAELNTWISSHSSELVKEQTTTTPGGNTSIWNADGILGKQILIEGTGDRQIKHVMTPGHDTVIYDSKGNDITKQYYEFLSSGNRTSLYNALDNPPTRQDRVCTNGTCRYELLAPIGNFIGVGGFYTVTQDSKSLCSLLNSWFRIGIALAGLFAVVMIVLGGIQYATTDSLFVLSEGKKKIQNALFGLLLALTTYLILYTINPALTSCEIDAEEVQLDALTITNNALVYSGNGAIAGGLNANMEAANAYFNTLKPDSGGAAEILQQARASIGTHQTCHGSAGSVGCADAVNTIVLRATGQEVGGDVSTTRMQQALEQSNSWVRVPGGLGASQGGDIVISPTRGGSTGHVGIVETAGGGTIISNSSRTGTVQQNYGADSWLSRFDSKGLPTYVYRKITP